MTDLREKKKCKEQKLERGLSIASGNPNVLLRSGIIKGNKEVAGEISGLEECSLVEAK